MAAATHGATLAPVRTVLQRVARASVTVAGERVAAIERGLLLLVGVERGDTAREAQVTADKVARLRLFPGPPAPDGTPGRPMDRSVLEVGGACLVVSQFTLAASLRKGRRPSFDGAEDPARARPLYEQVAAALGARGLTVATGHFGAHMRVALDNDGPVTLVLDVRDGKVCGAPTRAS